MTLQPGLCRFRSETPKTCFLETRLGFILLQPCDKRRRRRSSLEGYVQDEEADGAVNRATNRLHIVPGVESSASFTVGKFVSY